MGFRTDLDAPTWEEIHALMLHGAAAAVEATHDAPTNQILAPDTVTIAKILEAAGCPTKPSQPNERALKSSHRRPCRRLIGHACAVLVCSVFSVLAMAALVWLVSPYCVSLLGLQSKLRSEPRENDNLVTSSIAATPLQAVAKLVISVFRNNQKDDLLNVTPVRSGDEINVKITLGSGLRPTLFWLDTEGKLWTFHLPTSTPNLERTETYFWPGADRFQPVGGPAGTELILVCVAAPLTQMTRISKVCYRHEQEALASHSERHAHSRNKQRRRL